MSVLGGCVRESLGMWTWAKQIGPLGTSHLGPFGRSIQKWWLASVKQNIPYQNYCTFWFWWTDVIIFLVDSWDSFFLRFWLLSVYPKHLSLERKAECRDTLFCKKPWLRLCCSGSIPVARGPWPVADHFLAGRRRLPTRKNGCERQQTKPTIWG